MTKTSWFAIYLNIKITKGRPRSEKREYIGKCCAKRGYCKKFKRRL